LVALLSACKLADNTPVRDTNPPFLIPPHTLVLFTRLDCRRALFDAFISTIFVLYNTTILFLFDS
jgi:hypothetical protein